MTASLHPLNIAKLRFSFETKPHGEDNFARVIRGHDNELERDIAVKVLSPLATQFSPPEQERFRREARILARLSHPNIPSVYDVDFRPGHFIIISQFVEGTNLREILDEQGSIDFDRARSWFHQIASALEHEELHDFLLAQLGARDNEVFALMLLDVHKKLIEYVELFPAPSTAPRSIRAKSSNGSSTRAPSPSWSRTTTRAATPSRRRRIAWSPGA